MAEMIIGTLTLFAVAIGTWVGLLYAAQAMTDEKADWMMAQEHINKLQLQAMASKNTTKPDVE